MKLDRDTLTYVTNVFNALEAGTLEGSTRCGEDLAGSYNIGYHTVTDSGVVVIAREGYWTFNPNDFGVPRPNWHFPDAG